MLTRQHKTGAIVVQWDDAVGVADDADQSFNVSLEPQPARVTLVKIHSCLIARGTNLHTLPKRLDSGETRFCDSASLELIFVPKRQAKPEAALDSDLFQDAPVKSNRSVGQNLN